MFYFRRRKHRLWCKFIWMHVKLKHKRMKLRRRSDVASVHLLLYVDKFRLMDFNTNFIDLITTIPNVNWSIKKEVAIHGMGAVRFFSDSLFYYYLHWVSSFAPCGHKVFSSLFLSSYVFIEKTWSHQTRTRKQKINLYYAMLFYVVEPYIMQKSIKCVDFCMLKEQYTWRKKNVLKF